ncbi:hypothetical protein AC578_41, partial [Pseudocercospora eumusae]
STYLLVKDSIYLALTLEKSKSPKCHPPSTPGQEIQPHKSTETINNISTQPISNSMAPIRYRYISSRDITEHSADPIPTSSKHSAIEHYARLQNFVKRQQSQKT